MLRLFIISLNFIYETVEKAAISFFKQFNKPDPDVITA